MKLFKKLLSYIIAVTMVLSLATLLGGNVYADSTTGTENPTTYTLTLTGTASGHTYEAYQVFKGDLSGYTLSNIQWGTGINSSKEADLINALKSDNTLKDKFGNVTDAASVAKALEGVTSKSAEMDAFAKVVGQYLSTPSQSSSSNETETKITGLAAGYYLVKDKDNSQKDKPDAYTKFIVDVVGDTTAAIKSGVPTVEKKVKDINDSTGVTSGWQDSADADINDDVEYQITGTMPDNIGDYTTYKYVFTDTMSKGLTYVNDKDHKTTIKIGDTDVTESFKEDKTENTDGKTTVTWTCNNLKNKEDNKLKDITLTKDSTVVVTYFAKLNEDAVIGSAGNPNTVNLTYSNNPNKDGEGETGKTPDDKNIVFTYKAVVNKVDQDGTTQLKGAGFTLQKKVNGAYTNVKSLSAGDATTFEFTGLDDGEYKLIESTTPEGYNTITPIEFKIEATHDETADEPKLLTLTGNKADGTTFFATSTVKKGDKNVPTGELTASVKNNKGSVLPSTGGMGTTLLYAVGGVLVALAAAYIIISKKHEKAE